MNKQAPSFRALALIACMIGRRYGVTVTFDPGAETAKTDGRTITLPVVSNLGSEEHAVLIEGLVDHEAMHCRFSDFEFLRNLAATNPAVVTPFAKVLHNWLEDVWGEREQARIYPGCARNIHLAMDVMIRMGFYSGAAQSDSFTHSPVQLFFGFVGQGLLARLYSNATLQTFSLECRAALEPILGDSLLDRLWSAALKVDGVRSTQAAWVLTEELIGLLASTSLASQNGGTAAPKHGTGQRKGDGAFASPPGKSSGQSGPAESSQGAERGEKGTKRVGQESSAPAGAAVAASQMLAADETACGAGDVADRLVAALSADGVAGNKVTESSHALLLSGDASVAESQYQTGHRTPRSGTEDDVALQMVRSIEIKLGLHLEAALEARAQVAVSHTSAGRRMDARRLTRARAGRSDVFRVAEETEAIDTAVSVLMDASGSMGGSYPGTASGVTRGKVTRADAAAATLIAVGNCLEKFGIPFAVASFGDSFQAIKSFDEAWRQARGSRLVENLGGTPTDLACLRAAPPLLDRTETRKVLLLITDGEPRSVEDTLAVMSQLGARGIEVTVIVIDSNRKEDVANGEVARFFDGAVAAGHRAGWASSADQLAEAVFEAVHHGF